MTSYTEIGTTLLFRIEEAATNRGGRISVLPTEIEDLKNLIQNGFILVSELLVNNTHDTATHIVFLTESGWIEACQLRRRKANIGFDNYLAIRSDAKRVIEELKSNKTDED